MKKKSLVSAFIFLLSLNQAHATDKFTQEELEAMPSSVKKFVKYNRHLVDDLGYMGVKAVSFESSKNRESITAIVKEKASKNYPIYTAVVSDSDGVAKLSFRNYLQCSPNDQEKLSTKNLYVNGQKLSAYYLCGPAKPGDKTNIEIYQIKTDAGNEYVHRTFSSERFVFVTMDRVEVPFDTKGFTEVWQEANDPAL